MVSFLSKFFEQLNRYNAVVDDYREAAQQAPDSAMAYVNWGIRLAQEKQPAEALKKFETAAAMDATRPDVFASWGIALAKLGQLDAAIEKFEHAIKLDPHNADYYGLMGAGLVESGRLEEASETYAQALTMAPNHEALLVNWGIALARRGNYNEAIKRFKQSLAIRRYQPWVHFLWGVILAEQGEYDEAIEKFKLTLRLIPKHGEAYLFWCLCLNRLGKYELAIDVARDGLEVLDDTPDIYLALAEATFHTGQYDVALANARHALLLDEQLPEAYELMGQINAKQGKLEEAIQRFEKALALSIELSEPTNHSTGVVRIKALLGQTMVQAGQTETALPYLKAALDDNPDNLELLLLWASATFKHTHADEIRDHDTLSPIQDAVTRLFAVAEREPWHPRLQFLIGSHYLETGDYAQAVQALEKVVHAEPAHRDACIQLALAYCGCHQTENAVRCLRPLVRQFPKDERVLFYYAHMLYRHGEWRQAGEKYAAALTEAPAMTEARIGLAECQLMQGQARTCLETLSLFQHNGSGTTHGGSAVALLGGWATLSLYLSKQCEFKTIESHPGREVDPLLDALVATLSKGSPQPIPETLLPAYTWAVEQLKNHGYIKEIEFYHPEKQTHANKENLQYEFPLMTAALKDITPA